MKRLALLAFVAYQLAGAFAASAIVAARPLETGLGALAVATVAAPFLAWRFARQRRAKARVAERLDRLVRMSALQRLLIETRRRPV